MQSNRFDNLLFLFGVYYLLFLFGVFLEIQPLIKHVTTSASFRAFQSLGLKGLSLYRSHIYQAPGYVFPLMKRIQVGFYFTQR